MPRAYVHVMKATCVEELLVYQKALAAAHQVSAILKRPCFRRDPRLHDQLSASSDAVPSLIAEGFGQSSDRQFAQSLYKSRSESKETRTHLMVAKGRDYVAERELVDLCSQYDEIEKMETGLIRYLQREDRKFRG
jgi:four helix bundle protein